MTNDNKQDKDPKNAASSEAVTENVKITNYVVTGNFLPPNLIP